MTNEFEDSNFFLAMTYISGLINGAFFLLVWAIPELQAHPMKLFMYTMVCDSFVLMSFAASFAICDLRMESLLAYTIFYDDSCESNVRAMKVLMKAQLFFTLFASTCGLALQLCFCIDLILSLKSPFKDKESRMPIYYIFSVSMSIPVATISTFYYKSEAWSDILAVGVVALTTMLTWIMSIASIIYGLIKLCKPGISSEIRKQIMARHVLSIVFFLFAQFYLGLATLSKYNPFIDHDDLPNPNVWYIYILKILYTMQGFFMPLLRLYEPYFYTIVLRKIKAIQWPCSKKEKEKEAIMEERQNDLTFLKRGISDIDLSESHESRQNQSSLNRNDSTDSAD